MDYYYFCKKIKNMAKENICQLIEKVAKLQGLSAAKLGERIACGRSGVSKMYKKTSIDTALLGSISRALNHNFFQDLAANIELSGVDDPEAIRNVNNQVAVSQFMECVPKILRKLQVNTIITFGSYLEDIPNDIPVPDFLLTNYNITFTLDSLLYDKVHYEQKEELTRLKFVHRFTIERDGIEADYWGFHLPEKYDMLDIELKYRTEQEWNDILLKALEILRRYQYTPYRVFLEKGS